MSLIPENDPHEVLRADDQLSSNNKYYSLVKRFNTIPRHMQLNHLDGAGERSGERDGFVIA